MRKQKMHQAGKRLQLPTVLLLQLVTAVAQVFHVHLTDSYPTTVLGRPVLIVQFSWCWIALLGHHEFLFIL
jgi:hypothetical protein